MAQTKKKRRTKHRGNAAGIVEARGRTGRKPNAEERKQTEKELAAQARRDRMMRAPTWKSAAQRAALAAIVFGLLLVLLFDTDPVRAIPLTAFVFLFYVPLGFYTDQLVYRRRVKLDAKKKKTA
jgi:drug/metabolite transporter (DMT)-like permease